MTQKLIKSIRDGTHFSCNGAEAVFKFPKQGGGQKTFPLHDFFPRCSIAVVRTFSRQTKSHTNKAKGYSVASNTNINLTQSQKALLKIHFQLGHWNLPWIQALIQREILKCPEGVRATTKDALCQCATCNFAKETKCPDGAKNHEIRPEKYRSLKKDYLCPESKVFTDQFASSVPGCLLNTYRTEKKRSPKIKQEELFGLMQHPDLLQLIHKSQ